MLTAMKTREEGLCPANVALDPLSFVDTAVERDREDGNLTCPQRLHINTICLR